jgi:hypothetical protein
MAVLERTSSNLPEPEPNSVGEKKNAYRALVGKTEGKRLLRRHRCRWEDNIKMYFREIGWGGMNWTHLAQDRGQWRVLVNTVMNFWVP